MGLRTLRFHPLSDMPLFETQHAMRGDRFYPSARVLRSLAPRTPRRAPEASPCIVYHSPWGHLVVTEIDPENLHGYGWTCLSSFPGGAEWGDLGYMGDIETKRGTPWEYWERDLYSDDRTAAAAIARILRRFDPPVARNAQEEEQQAHESAAPAARALARVPQAPRGAMGQP
ncbi:hypothetical protein ABZ896_51205 [Streptomyces sp. NPDC047072]|uniref:hypothetical protein n=1 Tax=Streptomyces sp. NPDC047072 TaxID=3154809 RepID=UPI0033D3EF62